MNMKRSSFASGIAALFSLSSVPLQGTAQMLSLNIAPTRYNPLDYVRLHCPHDIEDALNLANVICDPDGAGLDGEKNIWKHRAGKFLGAAILHYKYYDAVPSEHHPITSEHKTLAGLASMLNEPRRDTRTLLAEMIQADHGFNGANESKPGTHPAIAATARGLLESAGPERAGILAGANRALEVLNL
jgi:type IV secretory pathway TraG/TraD family ATPase VirD4